MSEPHCLKDHHDLVEAIRHAEANLVGANRSLISAPLWGTRGGNISNLGKLIGFQTADGLRRWRLDFDPEKGAHINEENFLTGQKIIHNLIGFSELRVQIQWQKWASGHDKPRHVLEKEEEMDRRKREGFI